jgi:hypothetical protein
MLVPLAGVETEVGGRVVQFVGSGLLAVSAAVFAFYAVRNLQLNRVESQRPFWRYLVLLGSTSAAYGALGVAGVTSPGRWVTALGHATLLFSTVFLAFAMRELYYNSTLAPPPEERRVSMARLRQVETAFVGVIVLELLVVLLFDQLLVVALVKALGSFAFAFYGVVFAERLEAMARGTAIDTLRRHLLPVLVCVGLLGVVDIAALFGADVLVVQSVESVFVVMVGAFLLTATIRLQQNVHGLSAS